MHITQNTTDLFVLTHPARGSGGWRASRPGSTPRRTRTARESTSRGTGSVPLACRRVRGVSGVLGRRFLARNRVPAASVPSRRDRERSEIDNSALSNAYSRSVAGGFVRDLSEHLGIAPDLYISAMKSARLCSTAHGVHAATCSVEIDSWL